MCEKSSDGKKLIVLKSFDDIWHIFWDFKVTKLYNGAYPFVDLDQRRLRTSKNKYRT
jgi:hypothetical protein